MLEVELKFPLPDPAAFRRRLGELGAVPQDAVEQADAYYNHPGRDFGQTDEALRVRTVGQRSWVTYKGPKQGGAAKTRYELELPLVEGTADGWAEVLSRLGFREVLVVRKRRAPFSLTREGCAFELTIDEVERLGAFAEVETVVEEGRRAAAEQAVTALAADLGLRSPESRSYLEMLLNPGR